MIEKMNEAINVAALTAFIATIARVHMLKSMLGTNPRMINDAIKPIAVKQTNPPAIP
ncbi:MAG: hypothetical protein MJ233_04030 [Mycoplasmoidaceae bacterium]|nr:hypothetical protein [Mycoplasmoidaceae bacterium]